MNAELTTGRQRRATIVSASLFLGPAVLGKAIEWVLKGINPDGVDVSAGLAYLRPLLITGAVVFAAWLVLALVLNVRLQRLDGAAAARLPWLVLITQAVLVAAYLLVQLGVNSVTGG